MSPLSPAEELRAAVARVRHWPADPLIEPLAELLSLISTSVAEYAATERPASADRVALIDERGVCRPDWTAALAVARVINTEPRCLACTEAPARDGSEFCRLCTPDAHTRRCAAPGCDRPIARHRLMCLADWRLVPEPTQREVTRTYRTRQRDLRAHLAAIRAAQDAVRLARQAQAAGIRGVRA
ncbi:hypothetical protein [Sphaerisporangium sp. TRM90804]|uniref:hypothetical protein n=1 Tax=Sphaerisporangium sp. TRM90804 TaxID=3031113 RepID=UPI00244C52E2|nr:hypothetical protein [Sphaerisporangium sp. TRM90804]MDH2425751.1 hypothetical protein [Sphaerisporangium sp. TRM90804]